MVLTWRLAAPVNAQVVLELMREFYVADEVPFDVTVAGRSLQELFGNPALGRAWLIEVGGAVAGYIIVTFCFSLEFGGRCALIDELYVRPAFQRRGIASAALAFVEQEARAAGARALHLEVRLENERARRVYDQAGFEVRESRLMSKTIRAG